MASTYPASLDAFATNKADATNTPGDHAQHHDDLADAVNKIEAELGTAPKGSYADVKTRLAAYEGPGWTVAMQGLLAANFDPAGSYSAGTVNAAGDLTMSLVALPLPVTITNMVISVKQAGVTLTSGQCFGALYDINGTLLAKTASQHTAWQSTGVKTMALTAEAGQSLSQGGAGVKVILAVLWNGTTSPQLHAAFPPGANGTVNAGTSGLGLRSASKTGTGYTTPPSTITAGSASDLVWWMALS